MAAIPLQEEFRERQGTSAASSLKYPGESEERRPCKMETLERIISEHPFFRDLDTEHLQLLSGCATNARFRPGEPLFMEGGEANQFYLLREGRVSLEVHTGTDEPIVIQTMTAGDVLGFSWLIPPHRWRFDARATEE